MERLREKFETDKRGMEAAFAVHEKLGKNSRSAEKDIESAKAEADRRALVASESMEAYQQALGKKINLVCSVGPNKVNLTW
jgi:hypothetical protein